MVEKSAPSRMCVNERTLPDGTPALLPGDDHGSVSCEYFFADLIAKFPVETLAQEFQERKPLREHRKPR